MGVKILIAPQMGVVSREPRVPDTSLSHIINCHTLLLHFISHECYILG